MMNIRSTGKLRFAVSCSSNMNRSMEAHFFLQKRGFDVQSFGSGNYVKLPGPSVDKPNIYEFDSTTYEQILQDLKDKDVKLYTQNGLLNMLDRNRRIKKFPQKFQNCKDKFCVIICLEERVYDQIVEFMQTRESITGESVHVINFDIQDNHEEATIGALHVVELCKKLEDCDDLDNELDEVLSEFEANNPERNLLHTICFY
uniref:RNA polymerase II subunit A C-terminal domain phosphatase SSU72 n=1 Tax=Globodera rostochiensis TaxID=31243 RepID=A0A914HUG9_GLORO